MAQVRVDEILLNDVRFRALTRLIHERMGHDVISYDDAGDIALATCVRAFWAAQSYWRKDRQKIPESVWTMAEGTNPSFASLLHVGLAEKHDDGIYVCGAREFFDWYHDKSEAGKAGGIKSGEVRKKAAEAKVSKKPTKQAKQTDEASEADRRSNEPVSVSVSVSKSLSSRESKRARETTWEDDDQLAKCFAHLMGIPAYAKVFDREHDRGTLTRHMELYGLTVADMERVCFELRNYCDGLSIPVKSPRGKLSTFVQNFADRRPKVQPKPAQKVRWVSADDPW